MTRRNQRLNRKLHKRYLELGVIDASQDRNWRCRLFAASPHDLYVIDRQNVDGIPKSVARGVRRYRLSYTVCRVTQRETPFTESDWYGYEFFRFEARRYPDIVAFSANNPDIR